jgi:hypothetical protein
MRNARDAVQPKLVKADIDANPAVASRFGARSVALAV